MWKAFQDFVASSTNPQNPAVQEDADLQAAINASLGVTSGPSASPRSHDEDSLLQQAIAESKREFEQKALDTTITDIKALCTDLQLSSEMIALLEKNYPLYIKDCPNNSASLKKMDFKALLIAFRRLPEVEQDIIKVHMSESLEKEKGSVATQFNFFLNLQGDPKNLFKALLFTIEARIGDEKIETIVMAKDKLQRWTIYILLLVSIVWFGIFQNTSFVYFQY